MTLDGPFQIYDRDPLTGELTATLAPGVHYKTDPTTFATFSALLTPYRVEPTPLQNVWAGDDPAAPVLTVPLRFPDQATADAVSAQIVPPA